MRRWLAAILVLVASTGAAREPGDTPLTVRQSGSFVGHCDILDLIASGLVPTVSGGVCTIDLAGSVTKAGSCIGDPEDFCSVIDASGKELVLPLVTPSPLAPGKVWVEGTQVKVRDNGGTPTTRELCATTGTCATVSSVGLTMPAEFSVAGSPVTGSGTITVTEATQSANTVYAGPTAGAAAAPGYRALVAADAPWSLYQFGGDGSDGAFAYAGEVASCPAACTGGCSGSEGSGVCTLSYNSIVGRQVSLDLGSDHVSVVKNYTTIDITAGTVSVPTPTRNSGAVLVLRATGNVNITGTTAGIAMKGRGSNGATSGACASTNAGKRGGNNAVWIGGNAGLSGANAGQAGVSAQTTPLVLFNRGLLDLRGTGGGSCPVSGQVGAIDLASAWGPSIAGTGGGGGGCAASCSGTCGAGGRGGGMVWIETAGMYTCTSSLANAIDTRGDDGTTGGGGGGGGGTLVVARVLGTNTCAYGTAAGAAGASPPTNCGAGASGGAGLTIFKQVAP